ncbi:hypothetical protein CC80DRAFT_497107 [Byssothecium circinans]|uniref:Uncharacterized protein n=1 Tax=Byssothecium circinans TaxID=147558 RepID=A0A6A5TBA2_9PLEO|nr:hypothetical protein CC80DRAFT_497107 [Byssothecium circinans]
MRLLLSSGGFTIGITSTFYMQHAGVIPALCWRLIAPNRAPRECQQALILPGLMMPALDHSGLRRPSREVRNARVAARRRSKFKIGGVRAKQGRRCVSPGQGVLLSRVVFETLFGNRSVAG